MPFSTIRVERGLPHREDFRKSPFHQVESFLVCINEHTVLRIGNKDCIAGLLQERTATGYAARVGGQQRVVAGDIARDTVKSGKNPFPGKNRIPVSSSVTSRPSRCTARSQKRPERLFFFYNQDKFWCDPGRISRGQKIDKYLSPHFCRAVAKDLLYLLTRAGNASVRITLPDPVFGFPGKHLVPLPYIPYRVIALFEPLRTAAAARLHSASAGGTPPLIPAQSAVVH